MFRKKRRQDDADDIDQAEVSDGGLEDESADGPADEDLDPAGRPSAATSGADSSGPAARPDGPHDAAEVDDPSDGGSRVDLGGLWLPGHPGLEVRIEADQQTSEVVAVTLVLGESALQVQPFAAPRSEGIWDDVRAELRAGITQQGGTVDEVDGPFGTELRTRVPVRGADGSQAVQPARFVGVDGPRWFLRGVLTGKAAVEPETDAELVALFRDVVVVRGADPMAPRDPIPLRLPVDVPEPEAWPEEETDDSAAGSADDLKPFERGPEITEIR